MPMWSVNFILINIFKSNEPHVCETVGVFLPFDPRYHIEHGCDSPKSSQTNVTNFINMKFCLFTFSFIILMIFLCNYSQSWVIKSNDWWLLTFNHLTDQIPDDEEIHTKGMQAFDVKKWSHIICIHNDERSDDRFGYSIYNWIPME